MQYLQMNEQKKKKKKTETHVRVQNTLRPFSFMLLFFLEANKF